MFDYGDGTYDTIADLMEKAPDESDAFRLLAALIDERDALEAQVEEARRLISQAGGWAATGTMAEMRIVPGRDVARWSDDAKAWLAASVPTGEKP